MRAWKWLLLVLILAVPIGGFNEFEITKSEASDKTVVSNQLDSPYADACGGERQNRHDPLCIRIRRRSVTFPDAGPYDWIIFPGFTIAGVLVSVLLIGWVTKPRKRPDKKKKR